MYAIIPAASAKIGSEASNQPELIRDRINSSIMAATRKGAFSANIEVPSPANQWAMELVALGYSVFYSSLDELERIQTLTVTWSNPKT